MRDNCIVRLRNERPSSSEIIPAESGSGILLQDRSGTTHGLDRERVGKKEKKSYGKETVTRQHAACTCPSRDPETRPVSHTTATFANVYR